MADVIRMPLLSDTMTEGKISVWNKKIGERVKSDEAIADVETDKATMEVIPYVDGVLLYIGTEAGQSAKVNDIIAIIGKENEDISSLIPSTEVKNKQIVAEQKVDTETQAPVVQSASNVAAVTIPKELTIIRMPLLSDTMTEGKIVAWNKNIGDAVKADDALADVETDKATMEVIGYAEGTLLYKGVEVGEATKVNGVIAVIGKAGTDITPYLSVLKSTESIQAATAVGPEEKVNTQETPMNTPNVVSSPASVESDARLKASPLAKSMAKEKGIDLHTIQGSGDNGRIVKRDLDNIKASGPKVNEQIMNPVLAAGVESHTDLPLSQMRKIIAKRLSESKFTAPHFYLKTSVQMDQLMNARKQINNVSPVKISVNDMMIKAVSLSLMKHPDVNSSWISTGSGDDAIIRQNHHIHIGSAIALPDGLIVPVIKFANQKSLLQIANEANDLYSKARNKKIQPAEFTGNTFTISNLGMMDIDEFTAIINPPDACILAVGKIASTPVVEENNAVVIRNIMKLTLSCDHRAVDGAVGASFLQTLKGFLENPLTMLL